MSFWEPQLFKSIRGQFADQFSIEEKGIIYRKYGVGPGFQVSQFEHENFTRGFEDYISNLKRIVFVATIIFVFILVAPILFFEFSETVAYWTIGIYGAVLLAWMLIANRRALAVPAITLAQRRPSAPDISASDRQREGLKTMSWPTFALGPAAAAYIAFQYDVLDAPFSADRIFWTAMATGLLLLSMVQAVRKWLIEKEDKRRN